MVVMIVTNLLETIFKNDGEMLYKNNFNEARLRIYLIHHIYFVILL